MWSPEKRLAALLGVVLLPASGEVGLLITGDEGRPLDVGFLLLAGLGAAGLMLLLPVLHQGGKGKTPPPCLPTN